MHFVVNLIFFFVCVCVMQAYNLSRDHKPDLEVEKERILKAGGFIHAGRVNGSLNLARAIGACLFDTSKFLMNYLFFLLLFVCSFNFLFLFSFLVIRLVFCSGVYRLPAHSVGCKKNPRCSGS